MKLENPISPKVIVAAIVGIVLTAVVSNLSAITPDMLDFLGPWKLFVLGTLLTAVTSLAAWWKTDPLRVLPRDQETTTPAPAADSVTVNAPATAAEPAAPATTFTATQTKIDALPAEAPVPVIAAPAEVAPIIPN